MRHANVSANGVFVILGTLLATVGAGACYDPPRPDCAFLCGTDGTCGTGYYCAGDGWCKREGAAESFTCDPANLDAAGLDAPPIDAPVDAPDPDASIDAPIDAAVDAPVDAATAMLAIVTASPLAFGDVPQTQTVTRTVMVRNGGAADASALTVAAVGTGFARVADASDTCTGTALPAMATCSFDVTFTPATLGMATGVASAAATNGGTVSLNLTGVGVPALAPTPAMVTLADGEVGLVTFTNAGAAATGVLAVALTGASEFAIDSDGCVGMSVPAAGSCVVGVRFTGVTAGTVTATLDVTGTPGGPASVAISGTLP